MGRPDSSACTAPLPVRILPALFVLCLGVVVLEIAYTRLFSFKLYYYFTYLVIGVALLGGGAGGVLLSRSKRLRDAALVPSFATACLVAAVTTFVGYFIVAAIPLNASDLARAVTLRTVLDAQVALLELGKLLALCGVLFLPFCTAGFAISKAFASHPESIGRLYGADLVGAGAGCGIAVWLLWMLSPAACIGTVAAVFASSAALVGGGGVRGLGALLAVTMAAASWGVGLPDPTPDRTKTLAEIRAHGETPLFSSWNPIFRVDVLRTPRPDLLVLAHDGMWGAVMMRRDHEETIRGLERDVRAIPFKMLRREPRVAIIGAAGGHEIMASLHYGASAVTGIELNPVTVSLLRGPFAEFTGRLTEEPRVTLINAEGRSYLEGTTDTWDLVWFVAPDSYAAMNAAGSGAFVLSESYLYSAEMVRAALARVPDDGILCVQFGEIDYGRKPLRTARYIATARQALHELGIENFAAHVLVATTAGTPPTAYSTILLRRRPFSAAEVATFEAEVGRTDSVLRHPIAGKRPMALVNRAIDLDYADLPAWYARQAYDVSPATDDRPFFWHFVRFRDALSARTTGVDPEEGGGERLLFVLLVVSSTFAFAALVLPYLARPAAIRAMDMPAATGLLFAALGFGFMLLEIGLIQRLTLFLGYPTYTLTVTLCALLVSTGIGSMRPVSAGGSAAALMGGVGLTLGVMIGFYAFGLTSVLDEARTASFPARVAIALGVIAPVGLCLGRFTPLGIDAVARRNADADPAAAIAWAWAINGLFSVVGSVAATILSMTFGFRFLFLLAGLCYVIAMGCLVGLRRVRASVAA